MATATVQHVPMYFVAKVVTTPAQFFWGPLSATLVPYFVAAATGSVVFSFGFIAIWELVWWAIMRMILAVVCDGRGDGAGELDSDTPYCTGNFPFGYIKESVTNDGSGMSKDALYELSPSGYTTMQYFVFRSILIFVTICTGLIASQIRASLVYHQRRLAAKLKAGSDADVEDSDEALLAVQGIGYNSDGDNTNINKEKAVAAFKEGAEETVAPWIDITLGIGGNSFYRSMCLCCAGKGYNAEQYGLGGDNPPRPKNGADPVMDHINYMWLFAWICVITLLELIYELLPIRYNAYNDASHNFVWVWRVVLGAAGFGILLSLFFVFKYVMLVQPLSKERNQKRLKEANGVHAFAYQTLAAEWVTNYIFIVAPVIAIVVLVSIILTPILGGGCYDDINYSSTIVEFQTLHEDGRFMEFLIPLIVVLVGVNAWNVFFYYLKSSWDTTNKKFIETELVHK